MFHIFVASIRQFIAFLKVFNVTFILSRSNVGFGLIFKFELNVEVRYRSKAQRSNIIATAIKAHAAQIGLAALFKQFSNGLVHLIREAE